MYMWRHSRRASVVSGREKGAAAVEFALLLPLLLVILFGIIDFGLYLYDDLLLTHVARDAARYLSVNEADAADAAIDAGIDKLVSVDGLTRTVDTGDQGEESSITLEATYRFLTPLPQLVGLGDTAGIDASVVMRRE